LFFSVTVGTSGTASSLINKDRHSTGPRQHATIARSVQRGPCWVNVGCCGPSHRRCLLPVGTRVQTLSNPGHGPGTECTVTVACSAWVVRRRCNAPRPTCSPRPIYICSHISVYYGYYYRCVNMDLKITTNTACCRYWCVLWLLLL
jgi:hypothetical protein